MKIRLDRWDVAAIVAAILLCLCVVFFAVTTAKAQNVIRKNNTFIQQSKKKKAEEPTMTKYVYQDAEGNKYPIYVSSKGKYFIIKTSKKTGKQYRQYLPAITEQLKSDKQ